LLHRDDDISIDFDDDDPFTSPEDDLPAGFSSFHQRFPAIVSQHFREPEPETANATATADDGDLQRRIDEYLNTLMRPRR
jgi:hypothetical protein